MGIELKQVSHIEASTDAFSKPIGLDDFQHEISKKIKNVKFKERDTKTLWAYREGDNYAMGYIGFGSFRDVDQGKPINDEEHLYTVFSPNVYNGRYGGGAQMHMVQAKHMKKGVSNALKYLRPLSVAQTVKMSKNDCRRKANEVVHEASNEFSHSAELIKKNFLTSHGEDNALQKELKHMVETGYEFLDKTLGEQLRKAFAALKEHEIAKSANKDTFIFVEALKTVTGRQTFRVATDVNVSFYGDVSSEELQDKISVYTQEELPEELAGKLSVLSMLDIDGYVEGVGYRAAESVFYLRDV